MKHELLAEALNDLCDGRAAELESLAKAPNAALERRIAAILMMVTMSELPISGAVLELIVTLTDPDGIDDPMQTCVGQCIARWTKDPPGLLNMDREQVTVDDVIAIRLIMLCGKGVEAVDEEFSRSLRMMTGSDAYWWLDWIKENKTW